MATINPQQIIGKWQSGIALDLHTLSSTYLGVNEAGHEIYDTKRSEIGELLYRLKYRGDMAAAKEIIDTISNYLKPHRAKFDLIVPVPPSGVRNPQPVVTVATGVGAALGCPVIQCVTTTRETTQLKGVLDPARRKELVDGLYAVDATQTAGTNILLFDDLFRSGTTMNAITDELMQAGKAASVRVLTITRTRSHQ